ncbi:dynein light chain Tctex-type protein 2 isoform X2 [Grus americana]|uniref:dynein light chain Tctex-type protein 2 isoform X2 n=1 Tax=Grus americana TaxID=9117 RepID=UPI0024086273|nr:dynein light chain Tctex-type protein 2 isoform X2 [Grus americana]
MAPACRSAVVLAWGGGTGPALQLFPSRAMGRGLGPGEGRYCVCGRTWGWVCDEKAKGRRTQSNYEALGMAPVEEECFSDSMKAKLLTPKANRAKIRYANTYRLESHNKFRDCLVRDKAQAILMNRLQQAKYDGVSSPSLCASISEEILKAVKELDFDRYKLPADGSGMFRETLGFPLNVKLKHLLHWLW